MAHRLPHTQDSGEPEPDPAPRHAECELAHAAELLREHLILVAERTGQPLNAFNNCDVLNAHTLAYLVTLRHSDTDAAVHERATGLFFRLLQVTGGLRELALHAIGAVYAHAPASHPQLRVVKDTEGDVKD
jgi:hypothetical protein